MIATLFITLHLVASSTISVYSYPFALSPVNLFSSFPLFVKILRTRAAIKGQRSFFYCTYASSIPSPISFVLLLLLFLFFIFLLFFSFSISLFKIRT